jgi:hypothetical protein
LRLDLLLASISICTRTIIKEVHVRDCIYYSSKDALVKERARRKLESLWITVYKASPSAQIKKRALDKLNRLGAAPLRV